MKNGLSKILLLVAISLIIITLAPLSFAYISEPLNLQGELVIYEIDDFDNGRNSKIYALRPFNSDAEYQLRFLDLNGINLNSGSLLEVSGTPADSSVLVDKWKIILPLPTPLPQPPKIPTLGNQKTLVIMFNFLNDMSEPFISWQVDYVLFNRTYASSTNNFYIENSFGKTSFSGEVKGWYTVPFRNDASCDYAVWSRAADNIVIAEGVNLEDYDRLIYLFPSSEVCKWDGIGQLGGSLPTRSWINGKNDAELYSHEFGHNFGVHHASSLDCGSKQIDDYANCVVNEYGDHYDVMGQITPHHHFNAPHKAAMLWITPDEILEASSSGIYTISSPLEINGPGVLSVRIAKPDTEEYYYLEYRQPIGRFDKYLPVKATQGALIHVWDGNPSSWTKIIDANPSTKLDYDHALSDGASFYDSTNRIRITQLKHDNASVTVYVRIPALSCVLCSEPMTVYKGSLMAGG